MQPLYFLYLCGYSRFYVSSAGSKELLLEQKVPASYLALEDVIAHIAADRRNKGSDPVLSAQEYKTSVSNEMQAKHQYTFRDWAELHQATLFLHDNGNIEELFDICDREMICSLKTILL